MKKYIFLLTIIFPYYLFSQHKHSDLDVRIGFGYMHLGSGDFITHTLENELNYTLNRYITIAPAIWLGKSFLTEYDSNENTASLLEGNFNVFLSPFMNNKQNDLRIGGGLSYLEITSSTVFREYDSSLNYKEYYILDTNYTWGYNLIVEDTQKINHKFIVGIKLILQAYSSEDINYGLFLKGGINL